MISNLSDSNLYTVKTIERANIACMASKECIHVWHKRLGHRDIETIRKMINENLVSGIKIQTCNCNEKCETCINAKFSRIAFNKNRFR